MITGEIKNQIDSIWDTFWVGGITNSMSVIAIVCMELLDHFIFEPYHLEGTLRT
jgi:hypothetical protein